MKESMPQKELECELSFRVNHNPIISRLQKEASQHWSQIHEHGHDGPEVITFPGRRGAHVLRKDNYEHKLGELSKNRASLGDFDAHPPPTKPLYPANFGAEDFMRRSVGGYVVKYGENHAMTLQRILELGQLQAAQGRYIEAEVWLCKVFLGYQALFGRIHPKTIAVAKALLVALEAQRDGRSVDSVHGDARTMRIVPQLGRSYDELVLEAERLRCHIAVASRVLGTRR